MPSAKHVQRKRKYTMLQQIQDTKLGVCGVDELVEDNCVGGSGSKV
jgi:hypothetical protein